ncbi:MAG: hypothetical protein FWD36_02710 [Treponema sp.]|nr:hypothetical protein [Treponema sp.]
MIEFYDRTSYWLFVLEIPHVRGKELLSAVKFKLSSLYPGNISDYNIQIRKNSTKKWSYLVFVLDKNTGNTILPLSPLFAQYAYSQKTANVLYIGKRWIDYVRIENGAVLSSIVKIRTEYQLSDDVKKLCGIETNLIIYCDETDKKLLTPFQENNNIQFLNKNIELKKINIHKISLFSEKSTVIKRQRIVVAAAIIFFLILGSRLFYQHRQNENERNAQFRFEQEQQQKIDIERQRENQHLSALKLRYQEIISSKTTTPFDIAVVISECVDQQTRIQSATFSGNFFQIEGIANNSLELLNKFEKHRLVSSVRLHQVHPTGNRDTFTLSGTILIGVVLIDETLPTRDQIAILENLIAAEINYTALETQLSPSAFGEAVKALFTKWGCTANSYQFVNDSQETEIEYSLRGPGIGFFNALYEIKTKYRLWDVRLTQIRNLYPRNILDVVIRIKTEYYHPKSDDINAVPEKITNPFPIANISRNYFIPVPTIRPVDPVIREQPQIITTPAVAQGVNWLEYVGSVRDDDVRYIYLKNKNTGTILKLGNFNEGNMRYVSGPSGSIIVYIDDNIYEINRR